MHQVNPSAVTEKRATRGITTSAIAEDCASEIFRTGFHEELQRRKSSGSNSGDSHRKNDKERGFYRPPAATMVVGRRKLLALVANDRHWGERNGRVFAF